MVDDTARVATVSARADWLATGDGVTLDGLTALERAELSAHWSWLGQLEHASIAAFARFSLQLLSLGAPAELVEGCNRALVDETAHARLCFALASQYAGVCLGPGKLEVRDCFEETSLTSIMKLVLREGCIGETVAALDALDEATRTTDPVVASVLRRIARDEQAHAELGYRFLAWALRRSSDAERLELEREAEQRLAELGRDALEAVRRVAVHEVVRPLLTALFARTAAAA